MKMVIGSGAGVYYFQIRFFILLALQSHVRLLINFNSLYSFLWSSWTQFPLVLFFFLSLSYSSYNQPPSLLCLLLFHLIPFRFPAFLLTHSPSPSISPPLPISIIPFYFPSLSPLAASTHPSLFSPSLPTSLTPT